MSLRDLVLANRSYRRFDESHTIGRDTLLELVDLARLCPNGGNMQPLKYVVACEPETNSRVFPCLHWAAALKDWPGPAPGERPSAYIVILCDTSVRKSPGCDQGIAAQTMLLGAAERGLGGCMIGSVDRAALSETLELPGHLEISLVVALGKPAEEIVLEPLGPNGETNYYRDEESVHHVPKRSLEDVVVGGA